jgi:hypothetical protein
MVLVRMGVKVLAVIALAVFVDVKGCALQVCIDRVLVIILKEVFRFNVFNVQVVHDLEDASGYLTGACNDNPERRQYQIIVYSLQAFD